MKRNLLFLLTAFLVLTSHSCKKEGTAEQAALNLGTRFMREEPVTVSVSGLGTKADMTVDFGDGTVETARSGETVTHRYTSVSDGKGYIDYAVKVQAGTREFEKTIRVYDLLCITSLMQRLQDDPKRILNLTHRCNTTDLSIPENSISALNACIAGGIDAVEIDTHVTADGVVVISHDETINRCTDGTGKITEMTYAEIQQYNLLDRNGRVTTEKIPTLEEMLLAGRGRIYYDLDYSPRSASTEQVMSVVSSLGMMEQCWFYCNSVAKIDECIAFSPKTQVYAWVSNAAALARHDGLYFTQSSYNPAGGSTSAAQVASAEALGTLTSVITLDNVPVDRVEARHLDELLGLYPNVKMIMNNVGDAMKTALQERGYNE